MIFEKPEGAPSRLISKDGMAHMQVLNFQAPDFPELQKTPERLTVLSSPLSILEIWKTWTKCTVHQNMKNGTDRAPVSPRNKVLCQNEKGNDMYELNHAIGFQNDLIDRTEPCLLAKMDYDHGKPSEARGFRDVKVNYIQFVRAPDMLLAAAELEEDHTKTLVRYLAAGYVARIVDQESVSEFHVVPRCTDESGLDGKSAVSVVLRESLSGRVPDTSCTLGVLQDGRPSCEMKCFEGENAAAAVAALPEQLLPNDPVSASAQLLRFGSYRCNGLLYLHCA